MSEIALLNSSSDHGGKIITATAKFTAGGINGVVDGDLHKCPIKGHGTTPITGTSKVKSNGSKIVRVGDKAGCGATISTGYGNANSD